MERIKEQIEAGDISVGIELGSTRIKTVAVNAQCETIATGLFEWENTFKDGFWTYSLNDVWNGLQISYQSMTDEVKDKYGVAIKQLKSLGISGMMHGYLAFDDKDDLLVPFRTWRNNNAHDAARKLTEHFGVNIPERWSIAQLYDAAIHDAPHTHHIRNTFDI